MTSPDSFTAALGHLPHGPEFRFLDRLLQLDPGQKGEAEYLVKGTETFLKGHFPGAPLFPGVLLVEAGAQLAGVVAQSDPAHPLLPGLKLTAIRQAKILGSALPDELLHLSATITGRMANLVQADLSVTVAGRTVLLASITLSGDK